MTRKIFLLAFFIACVPATVANGQSRDSAAQSQFDSAAADAKAAMLIDPNVARAKAVGAERLALQIADKRAKQKAVATAEWLRGEASYRLGDLTQAEPTIARSLTLARLSDPKSKIVGDILLSSGSVHQSQGRVADSLNDFQSAHDIFQSIEDSRGQALSLICLSSLYNDANDNKSALKYLNKALDIYNIDPNLAISIYNNRGGIYQDLGQFEDAERQFVSALKLERQLHSRVLRVRILGNLARTRLKSGEPKDADKALREGLSLAASGEAAGWRWQLLAIAAQSALQQHQRQRAGELISQAFEGIQLAKTTLSFREAHKTAYETYRALNQPAKALVHLAALKRLDDEATKLATTTSTALMAARFDSANQELKITRLKQDELERNVVFERAQARTERMVFAGAAATTALIIAMLAVALFTIRRSRNETRAANADLAITNAALGKALAAKTEFLATTSHEIRTPLNGILGMTQVMLADTALDDKIRERIMLVHGAGITMRALVDDILDVAKMETGNMTIEAAPFDLRATLGDAARLWEEQARGKGVAFELDLAACPTMVAGDAARVRQVVFNLLSNALKFTADGSIAVRVAPSDDDSRIAIAVTDTGVGIPAVKLEEIFEAFHQADAGTTRQFGGTGLGLAICRNLARAMGGDVSVTSRPAEGSTFTVTLPLVRLAAIGPIVAEGAEVCALLVLDRNPITRAMFRSLFEPHVPVVRFAISVEDALARIATGQVLRVLIDDATVRSAGDALTVLATIADAARASGAGTTLLWPVAAERERQELLATGIDSVIAKPVSGGELVGAIVPLMTQDWQRPALVPQAA